MSYDVYQTFMTGYVRRINESTFNAAISAIKIDSAPGSRLAQVDLQNRVITFSRYAIENVPERGRRYLVIHQLAHLHEPSHNAQFWELVARFEPNYKQISRSLELAFRRNVHESQVESATIRVPNPLSGRLEQPKLLLSPKLTSLKEQLSLVEDMSPGADSNTFACTETDFGSWSTAEPAGIPSGFAAPANLPVLT